MPWQVAVAGLRGLGEGPIWDTDTQRLTFVDITGKAVHRYDPARGDSDTTLFDECVGAALPRVGGGLLLAMPDGVHSAGFGDARTDLVVPIGDATDPTTRLNDAKCDPVGRMWVGSMTTDFRPGVSTLYRIGPEGAEPVVSGCHLPNGLGWSPDGHLMYFADSRARAVYAFDYDLATGRAKNQRTWLSVPESDGAADGLCVDAEGCVWVAMYHRGRVHRYSPTGRLIGSIVLPVRRVTSVCFGGPGLADLYVTSSAMGADTDELTAQPLAGSLFVVPDAGTGIANSAAEAAHLPPQGVS